MKPSYKLAKLKATQAQNHILFSKEKKRMWFLLEQCETKIRAQTFNQSNIVDIGKVLFADSLIYKYSSIRIWSGILDLILPSNSGLSEWNQSSLRL